MTIKRINITPNRELKEFYILRALLALGIMAYHLSWLPVGFGQAILEGFFVLSGFLVTKSLYTRSANHILELKKKDILGFWYRRIRRLGFGLWVFVAVSFIVCFLIPGKAIGKAGVAVGLTSPFWVSNYLTIFGVMKGASVAPFGGLWSLAIEEQFYVALPLLFVLFGFISEKVFGIAKIGFVIIDLLAVSVLAMLFRIHSVNAGLDNAIISYSVQYRMMGFGLGCAAFLLSNHISDSLSIIISKFSCLIIITITVIFVTLSISVVEYTPQIFLFQWACTPVFVAILCLTVFISSISKTNDNPLESRKDVLIKPIVYVGKTSYSLYLYHPLVIYLIGTPRNNFVIGITEATISILLGIISFELVENRLSTLCFQSFEYWGKRFFRI
jgi:peptidoglycan/LPS O-acetylase OafA/YrhL